MVLSKFWKIVDVFDIGAFMVTFMFLLSLFCTLVGGGRERFDRHFVDEIRLHSRSLDFQARMKAAQI